MGVRVSGGLVLARVPVRVPGRGGRGRPPRPPRQARLLQEEDLPLGFLHAHERVLGPSSKPCMAPHVMYFFISVRDFLSAICIAP